jgi:hypothetical protein
LKGYVDTAQMGQIPDGSLGDVKLSNTAGQIKDTVTTHLADLVTDADGAHGFKTEAGTFTPSLKFGGATTGITYTSQAGNYRKLGNIVFFQFFIDLTSKGTAVGIASITGFPFVSASGMIQSINIADTARVTYDDFPLLRFGEGSNVPSILSNIKGVTGVARALTDVDIANTSRLIASGYYIIN